MRLKNLGLYLTLTLGVILGSLLSYGYDVDPPTTVLYFVVQAIALHITVTQFFQSVYFKRFLRSTQLQSAKTGMTKGLGWINMTMRLLKVPWSFITPNRLLKTSLRKTHSASPATSLKVPWAISDIIPAAA